MNRRIETAFWGVLGKDPELKPAERLVLLLSGGEYHNRHRVRESIIARFVL